MTGRNKNASSFWIMLSDRLVSVLPLVEGVVTVQGGRGLVQTLLLELHARLPNRVAGWGAENHVCLHGALQVRMRTGTARKPASTSENSIFNHGIFIFLFIYLALSWGKILVCDSSTKLKSWLLFWTNLLLWQDGNKSSDITSALKIKLVINQGRLERRVS